MASGPAPTKDRLLSNVVWATLLPNLGKIYLT